MKTYTNAELCALFNVTIGKVQYAKKNGLNFDKTANAEADYDRMLASFETALAVDEPTALAPIEDGFTLDVDELDKDGFAEVPKVVVDPTVFTAAPNGMLYPVSFNGLKEGDEFYPSYHSGVAEKRVKPGNQVS